MTAIVRVLVLILLVLSACKKGEENLRKANVLFKNGDLAGARAEYQRAADADPTRVAAFEGLGDVSFEEEKYADAIAEYRKALELSSTAMTVRHKLAVALVAAEKSDEAKALLEETVALDPSNAFAHNSLGGLHQKGGALEAAKAAQLAALQADPDFHAARFALGGVLLELGEVEEAEREYSRLEQSGQKTLARYGFARLAAKSGDWDRAANLLKTVLDEGVAHPKRVLEDSAFADGWTHEAMAPIKVAAQKK